MTSTNTTRFASLLSVVVFALVACSDSPTLPGDQDGSVEVTGAVNLNVDLETVIVGEESWGYFATEMVNHENPDYAVTLIVTCITVASPGTYDVVGFFEGVEPGECLATLTVFFDSQVREFLSTDGTFVVESRTGGQGTASLDFNAREADIGADTWHPNGATVRVRGPISWDLDGN